MVGLNRSVVDHWFTGTVSRIGGADMDTIAREIEARCQETDKPATAETMLAQGGRYRWRRDGESHQYNPETIPWLQQAVRQDDPAAWQRYRQAVQALNRRRG
jgi:glutamate synthase (NADPH/NADH) large chain